MGGTVVLQCTIIQGKLSIDPHSVKPSVTPTMKSNKSATFIHTNIAVRQVSITWETIEKNRTGEKNGFSHTNDTFRGKRQVGKWGEKDEARSLGRKICALKLPQNSLTGQIKIPWAYILSNHVFFSGKEWFIGHILREPEEEEKRNLSRKREKLAGKKFHSWTAISDFVYHMGRRTWDKIKMDNIALFHVKEPSRNIKMPW